MAGLRIPFFNIVTFPVIARYSVHFNYCQPSTVESGPACILDPRATSGPIESTNAADKTGLGQPGLQFRKNCTGPRPGSSSFVLGSRTRHSTATTNYGSPGAP